MRVLAVLTAALIVPATVALPVASSLSSADPGPVRASVVTIPLTGVAAGSLADTPAATTPVPRAGETHVHVGPQTRDGGPRLRPAAATQPTATEAFGLVGITAAAPFDPRTRVVIRIRESGEWQPWMELPISEHLPDPGTDEGQRARYATEPIATNGSDGVQVRIDTPTGTVPTDTQLTMIDNPVRPEDNNIGSRMGPASTAQAAVTQPPIITRKMWGADESLKRGETAYSDTIKVAFVHHVVSSNDYTPAQAAQQMRNVYSWFTEGIKVNDFGYNFMVDRYGRLYEGRSGGIDKAVIGAHTSGFNAETFAVSFLGNADTLDPTQFEKEKILDAIGQLVAWKFDLFDVNPLGTAVLTSAGPGPGGGTTSMYYAGEKVTTKTIVGHGDIGSTSCPGEFLRPTMAHLRLAVSALQGKNFYPPTIDGDEVPWGSGGSIKLTPRSNGPVEATMTVSNACGDPVRTLSASASSAAEFPMTWNLRDDKGKQVPPGTYTFHITAMSGAKKLYPWTGTARISATPDSPPDPCTPPEEFVVEGTGYGHGVGLSQWGAFAMARKGWSAKRIVEYYYPGVEVKPFTDSQDVRISLLYQKENAHVRVEDLDGSGAQVEFTYGKNVHVAGPAANFTLTPSGRFVTIRKTEGGTSTRIGRARIVNIKWSGTRDPGTAGTASALLNVAGPGESFSSEGHRYRYGSVDVSIVSTSAGSRLALVNSLRLHDEYLFGIAEVNPTWDLPALQAQVIASRSYALSQLAKGVDKACNCHMDDGDGPYYDQTFQGWIAESRYGDPNKWREAVVATHTSGEQGLTAVYKDEPINAFYTAATGGMTNSAADVWGGSGYPWSQSVDDHWSLEAPGNPYLRWNVKVTQEALAELFGMDDIMTVSVTRTLKSGSARELTAKSIDGHTSTASGSEFRSAFGLRSTYLSEIVDEERASTGPVPSGGVTLNVKPSGDVADGTVVTMTGQVKDMKPGLVVQRQVQVNGSAWQDRNTAVPSSDGSFTFTVPVTGRGTTYSWRVLVYSAGTVVASSPTRTAKVI
ncbi:MAG: FlgD immunoglobulin-like domain containing protein [Actinomycetota bacterium]